VQGVHRRRVPEHRLERVARDDLEDRDHEVRHPEREREWPHEP